MNKPTNANKQPIKKQRASNKKYKVTTPRGTVVYLTKQQKAYADLKLANPNQSLNKIARQAYPNITDPNTANQAVQHNENNKNIQIYTDEQVNNAKLTIAELSTSAKREETRLNASKDILDRTEGKAITRQVTHNTHRISISLG